jgi:hypothetical protein
MANSTFKKIVKVNGIKRSTVKKSCANIKAAHSMAKAECEKLGVKWSDTVALGNVGVLATIDDVEIELYFF